MIFSAVLLPILASDIGSVDIQQDTLGNYNLNVQTPDGNRQEHRNTDGSISGSYSFVEPNGKHFLVEYNTVDGGFQVKNPATVVHDTPEVAAARQEHLRAFAKQEEMISHLPIDQSRSGFVENHPIHIDDVLAKLTVPKIATLPSSDVPEVDAEHYAKKAELLKSYAENLEKLAQEYRSRQ